MSAQSNTEKVLRSLHVLLSQSEPYNKEPNKVIVDKQKVLDLLSELNKCVYDIMDEYELTKQSRDRAEREFRKKGDQIVWDASRKAEDIYAASVMYTDETLNSVQEIMKKNHYQIQALYDDMDKKLKEQELLVKRNQSELKSQLQDLLDTEKYLKLIEQRNQEIEKEKAKREGKSAEAKSSHYANRQTEVRVNTEVLEQLGYAPVEDQDEAKSDEREGSASKKDKELEAEIRINLDSDYFAWKAEQEKGKQENVSGETKKKSGLFGGLLAGKVELPNLMSVFDTSDRGGAKEEIKPNVSGLANTEDLDAEDESKYNEAMNAGDHMKNKNVSDHMKTKSASDYMDSEEVGDHMDAEEAGDHRDAEGASNYRDAEGASDKQADERNKEPDVAMAAENHYDKEFIERLRRRAADVAAKTGTEQDIKRAMESGKFRTEDDWQDEDERNKSKLDDERNPDMGSDGNLRRREERSSGNAFSKESVRDSENVIGKEADRSKSRNGEQDLEYTSDKKKDSSSVRKLTSVSTGEDTTGMNKLWNSLTGGQNDNSSM